MTEIKEQDLYMLGFKDSGLSLLVYNLPRSKGCVLHYMVKYPGEDFVGYARELRYIRLTSISAVKKIIALNTGEKND